MGRGRGGSRAGGGSAPAATASAARPVADGEKGDRQILASIHRAIKAHPGNGDLVPIHAVRDRVEAIHGKVGTQRFNDLVFRASNKAKRPLDILESSDSRKFTAQQISRSIPGTNATFAYFVRKTRG